MRRGSRESHTPANPNRVVGDSGEVGPPARIYWARRVPAEDLARLLAVHLRDENCPHVALRHCTICIEGHLTDLIAHLSGEAHPGPRQGAGRK